MKKTSNHIISKNENKPNDKKDKESFFRFSLETFSFFSHHISADKIGVFSAQASFFMLLSIFPIIMLFLNIISHTTLPSSLIPGLIKSYAPDSIRTFLLQVFSELEVSSSGTVISLTAIFAVWSASKGALSIVYGMRQIYKADKNFNYFVLRFISMIYTILLVIAMVLALVLLVFGNSIYKHLVSLTPILGYLSPFFTFGRYVIVMCVLTLFFITLYKMGGNRAFGFMDYLPGAMFSSLGWMIFSYMFSIYIDNFSNFSYMYGSLTAVIIIMLWMYFCMYITFIGAEINKYLYLNN